MRGRGMATAPTALQLLHGAGVDHQLAPRRVIINGRGRCQICGTRCGRFLDKCFAKRLGLADAVALLECNEVSSTRRVAADPRTFP